MLSPGHDSPRTDFCQIKKAGSTSSVAIIIEIRPVASSRPILAVPRCAEKARLPMLNTVVSELTITPRVALVLKILRLWPLFLPKTIRDMDRAIDADAKQQRQADDIGEIERDLKQQDKAGGKEPAGQDGQQYQHGVPLDPDQQQQQ